MSSLRTLDVKSEEGGAGVNYCHLNLTVFLYNTMQNGTCGLYSFHLFAGSQRLYLFIDLTPYIIHYPKAKWRTERFPGPRRKTNLLYIRCFNHIIFLLRQASELVELSQMCIVLQFSLSHQPVTFVFLL